MKRGAPLKRTKPMSRGKANSWPRRPAKVIEGYTPRPRDVAVAAGAGDRLVVPVPKENVLDHKGYMDLVRVMPCRRCGRAGPSQFCHADEGKGIGIKTDCRRGWPGCPECHEFVGSTGKLGKEGRRLLEAVMGLSTRTTILLEGQWPASLPLWPWTELEGKS